MFLRLRLRIRYVDMNAFLGRENHPVPEMVGQIVNVDEMFIDSEGYQIFDCHLVKERVAVTLVAHEIEFVDATVLDTFDKQLNHLEEELDADLRRKEGESNE
jgi:hypothetical protein